ncbi:MAG: translation initiation factor [Candidatus Marinimicrobia bacterium]|nr:translation initiation factor [Candidatus Neomarinimicrobiota bacterium]
MLNNNNIVYSTDNTYSVEEEDGASINKNKLGQHIYLHLDRKKGGKIITVIKGFSVIDNKVILLSKKIKKKCAVGGSIKNKEIIIQGNKRDAVKVILEEEGFKPIISGG